MKLVDILARELKVWPEGVVTAVQDLDGEVKFDNSHEMPRINKAKDVWVRQGDQGDCLYPQELAEDCSHSIVTHAQWQAAVDALKAEKVVEWSGEGLPPVGVDALLAKECKFTEGTKLESFPAGTVVYVGGHANFGGCDLTVIIIKGRHFCGTIIPELLEPVRTPEQIAKQERSKACDKMYGKIPQDRRNNGSDICEALYDAGYRKFEIVDN